MSRLGDRPYTRFVSKPAWEYCESRIERLCRSTCVGRIVVDKVTGVNYFRGDGVMVPLLDENGKVIVTKDVLKDCVPYDSTIPFPIDKIDVDDNEVGRKRREGERAKWDRWDRECEEYIRSIRAQRME